MGDIEKAFPSVESALRWADAMDHSGAKTLAAAYRTTLSSLEAKSKECEALRDVINRAWLCEKDEAPEAGFVSFTMKILEEGMKR